MDQAWLDELSRCGDSVRAAVRDLLQFSGAAGMKLRFEHEDGETMFIVIGSAGSLAKLISDDHEWQTGDAAGLQEGPAIPQEVLAAVPEEVREGLLELTGQMVKPKGGRPN